MIGLDALRLEMIGSGMSDPKTAGIAQFLPIHWHRSYGSGMSDPKTAGIGYRFLKLGERIRATDQVYWIWSGWKTTSREPGSINVSIAGYRRRVEKPKKAPTLRQLADKAGLSVGEFAAFKKGYLLGRRAKK